MKRYRVLIVDNQRDRRRKLRSGLKSLEVDFEVIEAASGEEALLILARQPIDLLVSGMRLAGISGVELLHKARRQKEVLKAILLLATSETISRQQASDSGADVILPMPVDTADFLDAVERCLGLVKSIPQPPAEEVGVKSSPAPSLTERLAALRRELKAEMAALLDEQGRVQAQAGEMLETTIDPGLLPAIKATISAGARVSMALGAAIPQGIMYFPGELQQVCIAHVGPSLSLLLVRKQGRRGAILSDAGPTIRAAVDDLRALVTQLEAPPEATPDDPPLQESIAEVEDTSEADAHLDEVFSEATRSQVNSQDVDAFWDVAAGEHNGEGGSDAGALSYEQARRLGLAPNDSA